ncbi:MAG: baseplate J/gp47 family protein [Magnetospirillum sp.]|nr:baseplate J/gp47 family protein [Magnetospirillum sp.]
MALDRPDYKTLFDRYAATVETRLTGADARLPGSDLNVSGHVIAETASGLYDFGLRIADQILEDTADEDQLIMIAADWAIYPQLAVAATGMVTLTRTGTGDVPVKAGTIIQCGGQSYITDAEITVSAATAEVAVTAIVVGAAGNLAGGLTMTLAQPIAGLSTRAVSGEISGGTDKESPASLLSRLQARKRRAPHGGNADDFERWAKSVPGVTRAWPYRAIPRRGFVTVLVVRDGNAVGPIPTAGEVADVQAYITRKNVGPIGPEIIVRAPEPVTMDYVIQISPKNAEVEASVLTAMRAWYRAESEPGFLGARSRLSASISAALGEEKHKIVAPAEDPALTLFQMAVVGSVEFEEYA